VPSLACEIFAPPLAPLENRLIPRGFLVCARCRYAGSTVLYGINGATRTRMPAVGPVSSRVRLGPANWLSPGTLTVTPGDTWYQFMQRASYPNNAVRQGASGLWSGAARVRVAWCIHATRTRYKQRQSRINSPTRRCLFSTVLVQVVVPSEKHIFTCCHLMILILGNSSRSREQKMLSSVE